MVATVPGSTTVEVLVTQDFNTRGTKVYRPVKHGHGLVHPSTSEKTLLKKKALNLPMVMTKLILKES